MSKTESEPKDKQGNMSKEKIDVGKALELRLKNGLSFGAIAKQLGCSRAYVHKTLPGMSKGLSRGRTSQPAG